MCNVDNELRRALVLLQCPPILADWRTTINIALAHCPRGRRENKHLASVNSILTVPTRFFQNLSHCHRLPKHLAGNLRNWAASVGGRADCMPKSARLAACQRALAGAWYLKSGGR